MIFLAGIWQAAKAVGPKVWAGLAIIGAFLFAYLKGRGDGAAGQRIDQLEQDDKVKDAQLDAAARRPRTDDDLDQRLRGGRF